MDPTTTKASGPPRRLAIWELCLLIAGVAIGLWLFGIAGEPRSISPFGVLMGLLGGASIVGPPILLWHRRRRRRRWGPGELLWFSQGTAAWLLWPPIVIARARPRPPQMMGPGSMSAVCYIYGTPLMALYVGSALIFGGWIRRPGRRRRAALSWRERFGLILGAIWAATGLYVLYLVYNDDIK